MLPSQYSGLLFVILTLVVLNAMSSRSPAFIRVSAM